MSGITANLKVDLNRRIKDYENRHSYQFAIIEILGLEKIADFIQKCDSYLRIEFCYADSDEKLEEYNSQILNDPAKVYSDIMFGHDYNINDQTLLLRGLVTIHYQDLNVGLQWMSHKIRFKFV